MNEQKEEKKYDFITPGIYKQLRPESNLYKFEDFTPVLIDNRPKLIGEGRFSKVYLYKNKNNNSYYALKSISINKILESGNDFKIIQREIDIHSRITHENIVQFYAVKENVNEVSILLEYCRNGSIYELISKNGFNEYKSYLYFSQVVNAVYFLHKNNLVHRDLKPENILLNSDKIKLCDFGWCCETNTNNRKSFCGTFEYMAPEIINELPYGKPVDIWALGILLYEFYYGISPFSSDKENNEQTKEIIDNILQKKLVFPNWKNISNEMKDLITKMLEMDVSKRYTIEQVVEHPWFEKCRKEINNQNQNINFYSTFKEPKVTKIIKNRKDIIFNTNMKYKTDINKRYNMEENIAEKTEKNIVDKSSSKSVVVNVKKLKNIDINTHEDNEDNEDNENNEDNDNDSIPIRRQYSIDANSINDNIIFKENIISRKYNCDTYRNIQRSGQSNNNKKLNTIPIKKITKLNKDNGYIYKSQNSISDKQINSHYFFPMDNILEETTNEKEEESISSFPLHASVIKLKNKDDEKNNTNPNSINANINKNNSGNQIFNNNYITNNYFLTNNYYTITYNNIHNTNYNGQNVNNSENSEIKNNHNKNFYYPFLNQYYV